ncbi:MAG: hypothetical protein E3J87_08140 [Candidatus Cloacimonadota bacterium]|nr:MAG: hypothetical protein E3J87_08140 [Candidatus Cloacimonadota bacterium]
MIEIRISLIFLCVMLLGNICCTRKQTSVINFPEPTGPFGVGTIRYYFIDTNRPETFTPDLDDHREVAIRIWYPAKESSCINRVPYIEHAEERKRTLPKKSPLPASFFDKISGVKSHSYKNAEFVDKKKKYPIIIFSHAYGAGMNQSTVLMEELASHGYIAISVGHAYETSHFVKEDGTVKVFHPQNKELFIRAAERQNAMPVQRKISQTNDPKKIDTLIQSLIDKRPKIIESLHIWVNDISFLIDELEKMNNEKGLFYGRLDTERIGVLGHSFGGVAAGQACLVEKRCKAGINLDGLQLGDMIDKNLKRPFMFMHHDNIEALNRTPNKIFFLNSKNTTYLILIKGTRHLNFSDLSLPGFSEILGIPDGLLGKIEGLRCLKIQNDYIRAFFDKHLCGKKTKMLEDSSTDYSEVEIMIKNK